MEENPVILECTISQENPYLPEIFTKTLGKYVYFDPHKDPLVLRTEEEHKGMIDSIDKNHPKIRLLMRYLIASVSHLPVTEIGREILRLNHWKRAVLEISRDPRLSQYLITVTEHEE